mmetsp:Transcript_18964/g.27970  ORF Transcript_18964/g.27970 Transcript_18964/m.27970 type:complete len:204 (-) Transcript_18964:594-1205(-)
MALSKRPGLKSALSITSNLLVAPITTTPSFWLASMPSISFKKVARTLFSAPSSLSPFVLIETIESSSSKKSMAGEAPLASLKLLRMVSSASPKYGEYMSAPESEMNVDPTEFAAALTKLVLLHPGGPWSKIPRGIPNPKRKNALLYLIGHSMFRFNSTLTSSRPPMSSQQFFGTSRVCPLKLEAPTNSKALSKSSDLSSNPST